MADTLSSLNLSPVRAREAAPAGNAAPADGRFGEVWRQVQGGSVEVRRGDTLTGIVKRHHAGQGQVLSEPQAYRMALQLARSHRIQDPDRILPGQRLDLAQLADPPAAAPTVAAGERPGTTAAALGWRPMADTAEVAAPSQLASRQLAATYGQAATHPVLEQTLQRAVQKGFVPAHEAASVQQRILALADKFGFAPDDFAKVALMESDGLNPKASNGRCFGIIQFCGGPGRGADSVGFGRNARDIAGMSVLQQLDLVERYFQDVGLGAGGKPLRLDDLYLSVLMPSARRQAQPHAALDIAGQQAARLHVGGDRSRPITRQSIVTGLAQHAMARLGPDAARSWQVGQVGPAGEVEPSAP